MTPRELLGAAAFAAALAACSPSPVPDPGVDVQGSTVRPEVAGGGAKVLWPLGSGTEPLQIGTTYGQFQQIGSPTADYHDGIDVLVEPEEPVFALEAGVVMYVRGTKGSPESYGVAVESLERPGAGFYYVHFSPGESEHFVGQEIARDQPLGVTVHWTDPVDTTNYDHLHLSLVEMRPDDPGEAPTEDPLIYTGSPLAWLDCSADAVEPEVLEILFLKDGTASELGSDVSGEDLHVDGAVDVVARVQDGFLPAGSGTPRLLTPYAVRLEILRATSGELCHGNEIVFDGPLGEQQKDMAQNIYKVFGAAHKSIGTYSDRAFYVIATNVLPYENGAWDAAASGPGEYVVRVTVSDLAGHEKARETRVTVP